MKGVKKVMGGATTGPFSLTATDLTADTTYVCLAFFRSGNTIFYSASITFTTAAAS
jgi:hypothetical protein